MIVIKTTPYSHYPGSLCHRESPRIAHDLLVKSRKQLVVVKAAQEEGRQDERFEESEEPYARLGQTRLATRVTTLPRRVDLYFAGK